MTDHLTRPAADLGREIAAGRLDPVALTESYLDAIAASEHGARIYARTTPERALAEAQAAAQRAKNGVRRGPLDGVPISWKDLFDIAGTATEAGSALLKGRVPTEDAEVLARATRAGLVCLGKTHMTELAFAGLGYNPVTATPPNINDPELLPGGSSSGAATSVAFGLAAAGIGSDTGGSVRVPSAWNDLVGLKTTSGALPLDGVVPLCAYFDTIGPLCRTVEDAALIFDAFGGGAAPDLKGGDASNLRLAVLETVALDDLREAPGAAFEDAVTRLSNAGARIDRIAVPEVAEGMEAGALLFAPEAYATQGELIEANPDVMFAEVRDRFLAGAKVSAADYLRARARLEELRKAYRAATAAYDAVLVPTAPILAPNAARVAEDGAFYRSENLMALRNTRIGNLMGLPVLTLPTGTPMCGLSVMGCPMGEAALLRIGAAVETALGVR
ncbi:amidase [Pontivivens ytuae]|uniref:Amidase n=1 Tax=Pontivivens ytuae TaxID=2789856 RepID=A0A7S9LU40_9RHOB|nr:amidase [Pontivivens ytuae]QPH55159.1 amidase [Pontivivens ytuae]